MSLTSKQIDELRAYAKDRKGELAKLINDAADTIEMLSDKLHASQMERSSQYYHGGWIPVSERLPEKETVLATVETKTFKYRYVCEAVWIPRWTWKASFDSWEDCSEYNEDEDEYYVLEGWYERVHNWDDYSYVGIEDDVIAWQPMLEPFREEGE